MRKELTQVLKAAAVCLLAGFACAQETAQPPSTAEEDKATIVQLVRQVRQLEEKVAALEGKPSAAPAPTTPLETPANNSESTDNGAAQMSAFQESHDLRGIHWRGFGEVDYKVLDQRQPELSTLGFVPGSAGNFYTGDFDLFLTSKLTEKASVLAEIVIGERDAQSFNIELARALLNYDYNDHLRLSLGRYHTSIGYYNTAFHSGRYLQTAVDRPLVMAFATNGGLLPTQAIGLSVTGQIPSGRLGLNYIAEYGSSDTVRPDLDGMSTADENNGNHFNIGLFLRPESVPGLQVGASYYHDRISDFAKGPTVRLGQTIVNGHVVYAAHNLEILNEAFLIREAYESTGSVFNMPAFYTQFSKRYGKVRPYARYQYVNLNRNSFYHGDALLRHGPSFGVRYDFTDSVAFKAQLDHTIRTGKPNLNGLQFQLAFAF